MLEKHMGRAVGCTAWLSGFALGHNWIKALGQLQKVHTGTFQQGLRQPPCSLWLRSAFEPNMQTPCYKPLVTKTGWSGMATLTRSMGTSAFRSAGELRLADSLLIGART
jgi:hypothetical protein